jgi:hypothetical protein
MTTRTFVFLISAFKAPTPPWSPADMPSTSSMMRHILSVMVTPRAFVAWHTHHSASTPTISKMHTSFPPIHPSNDRLLMFMPFWQLARSAQALAAFNVLTSTSFLLCASLAFSSIGVNPSSFTHKCVLVVLPMPGGPEMRTVRKMFILLLPGFLKPDFKLNDLPPQGERTAREASRMRWTSCATIAVASPLDPCSRTPP